MATQNRMNVGAIGIDLGTSKCCVAAVRDGRAHVLENEFGQRTTPSWVAFNSQQRLVGGAALDQAVVNCANTVSGVKRTLGRTYDDVKGFPSICEIRKCYSNSNFAYCVNYRKRQLQLSPEQITAMMLTKMTDVAYASLGCEVNRAVISVPACYGNAQRAAIINAANVAGLEVLQLINETTAAGIAFEHNRSVKTPVTIAVVDFGAGKLDISVMEVEGKSIKVIGASGSPYLGGCIVDELLVNYCVEIIQQKYGSEVKISDKARIKLHFSCEKAKKTLSRLPETQVIFESLFENCDVQIPLHRQNICELIDDDFRSTIIDNFERIFKEKSMGKDVIEKVVVVGGSRRIPAVKSILEEYFGSHKLDYTVNQDEAVAQGAALRAAALSGAVAGIDVSDVSSFDVYFSGSSKNKSQFDKIFNKFSPVPSIRCFNVNELRGSKVRFFERMYRFDGSKCDADLLSVEFTGSFASSDRFVNAELTLHLNESGMFSIFTQSPNKESGLKLISYTSHYSYEINNWMKEEGKFRCDSKIEKERVDAKVELGSLCYDVQSVLSELEFMEDISHHEFETSRNAVSNAMDWMTNNIEAAPLFEIQHKVKKVNDVKKDVIWRMNTARKKAIEKIEAAKKQAEIELLGKQILAFKLELSEVIRALLDSNLVLDFYPLMLKQCKDRMSSLMNWNENIESASLTEVTLELEELTQVKREVDQLKADAAREKRRIEAENEAARKLKENEFLNTRISEFESLLSEAKCTLHDTIFVTYSDRQIFNACESELNSLLAWKKYSDTVSITQVSQKLEELTQLTSKVDQMKTDALEEARGKEGVEKQREVQLHKEKIWSFKSLLCEVKETLDDLHPVSSSYSSKFLLCEASFHRLKDWKEIIEAASVTLVSNKLEELTHLKHKVDQLKTDVERLEGREIKEVTDATLARDSPDQQTCSCNSSNSFPSNGQISRNVAWNSIHENNERIKKEKHAPRGDLARSKEYDSIVTCLSKETQTASTTASAIAQTNMALLENNHGYRKDTSSNDESKELSVEVNEKVWKFENLGILLPWLEIMENAMSNMVNCEQCKKYRFSCSHHLYNGFKEVSEVLNSVPEILSQNSPTRTEEVNLNNPTTATLEPAENVGARQRYTTLNYPWKNNELSNGSVDSVQGPTAVPRQKHGGV